MGASLGHFLGKVAQLVEFGADSLNRGQLFIVIAFLANQLASYLRSAQTTIEAVGAKLFLDQCGHLAKRVPGWRMSGRSFVEDHFEQARHIAEIVTSKREKVGVH